MQTTHVQKQNTHTHTADVQTHEKCTPPIYKYPQTHTPPMQTHTHTCANIQHTFMQQIKHQK